MAGRFEYFVVLADMRTGSNLLEESLNSYPRLTCHGEVFNPGFIGHAGQSMLFDMTLDQRERDPFEMIGRLRANTEGLAGFRLFPDHDPRVMDRCLKDPACAKIVLARNALDSFVSLKIARKTGQWWLSDLRSARSAKAEFMGDEFAAFLDRLQGFYRQIQHTLQTTAQTAFHIHYDDLGDEAVLDGLARYLGSDPPATDDARRARVQNPESLEEKVVNFHEIEPALSRVDYFDIFRVPDFEPRRSANVPTYLAASRARLLFMPIAGGPVDRVAVWLEAVSGGEELETGATQKLLRRWKRKHDGHRSFTVVTHPLERAHRAFCRHILGNGPDAFVEIRNVLRGRYKLRIPENGADGSFDPGAYREAFLDFLGFLKGNLGGQTSVRVPAAWASQAKIVQGMADFLPPDAILRSETLQAELDRLCDAVGIGPQPLGADGEAPRFSLADIYDEKIEELGRAAYQRDYMAFGYGAWAETRA